MRRSRTVDALDRPDRIDCSVNQYRIDCIHQSSADLTQRRAQHTQDRGGDQQANHRVGPAPAKCSTAGAEQYSQAGKPVGASVQAIGDQCR
jgi:hypothetical protein